MSDRLTLFGWALVGLIALVGVAALFATVWELGRV